LFPATHGLRRLRITGASFLLPPDLAGLVASPALDTLELAGMRALDGDDLSQLLSAVPPACGEPTTTFPSRGHCCRPPSPFVLVPRFVA
jgi:hypothetical protein